MKYNKSNADLCVLVGEKGGVQARDNGFAFFKHRIESGYKNTYFVFQEKNLDIEYLNKYKGNIVLKNSNKHKKLFSTADYLMVNDGYLDVFPDTKHSPLSQGWAPIIYMQHGIISYKRVFFHKGHYNGRIRYFSTSLESENIIVRNSLQNKRDLALTKKLLSKYKIPNFSSFYSRNDLIDTYNDILEKYYKNEKTVNPDDLQSLKTLINNIGFLEERVINCGLSRHELLKETIKDGNNVLFFFTWRDEWVKPESNEFIALVSKIINSKEINKFISKHNLKATFYLHEKITHLKDKLEKTYGRKITFTGGDDFSDVLTKTKICITDYSSVAFEFNLLKTPVIFLHFDYDHYKNQRGHYLKSPYDFKGKVVCGLTELESFLSSKNILSSLKSAATKNYISLKKDYVNYGKTNYLLDEVISERQKHLVYFCYNIYGVGGTVQTVINQANYLVKSGFQVSIISLRRTSDTPKLHLDPSVRIEYLNDVRSKGKHRSRLDNFLAQFPSKKFKKSEDLYLGLSLLTDIKLTRIIKTLKNSILIGTFPGLCTNLIKYSNKSNKIIIQEHRELSSHSDEIKKSILEFYPLAHKVVTLTIHQKNEYANNKLKNLAIIPNGLEDKLQFIKSNTHNENKNRIVSFGRLVEMKQFDFLIDSFSLIANDFPEWTLDIYGDGDQKDNLLEKIKELDLVEQVRIYPSTALVYEELYNCSFCALTSQKEAFGMVYIESFCMGKPVISYDIGYGPKEFLKDNYNCLVSPCFNIEHYSKQMRKLMTDEKKRLQLGENARKTFLENYEISKVMHKFLLEVE